MAHVHTTHLHHIPKPPTPQTLHLLKFHLQARAAVVWLGRGANNEVTALEQHGAMAIHCWGNI